MLFVSAQPEMPKILSAFQKVVSVEDPFDFLMGPAFFCVGGMQEWGNWENGTQAHRFPRPGLEAG